MLAARGPGGGGAVLSASAGSAESGEQANWFALSRGCSCWLVREEGCLRTGDVVWNGQITRLEAEAVRLQHCDGSQADDGSVAPTPAVELEIKSVEERVR